MPGPARALLAALLLAGCEGGTGSDGDVPVPAARAEVLATGAGFAGANGLHFSPDGLLYVASVMGSELVALDPETGDVRRRYTAADGVDGPDDVAFAPDGSFYWTSILTGEVAGFTPRGERVVAAELTPGVNPITFAPDGRLFVAQCFLGDGLYELDPQGRGEPRAIDAGLGPDCGLNGMDWGVDGRLYGPRWFHGEVVSIDVASGERRLVADGFDVPAAVKFDSQGRLYVLDTGAGEVVRLDGESREVVATLTPGLDNLALDADDRLFVSSFTDGFVARVESDGSVTRLSPGGMAHPGGVAVIRPADGPARVVVADLNALRGFDPQTGDEVFTRRNIVGVGPLGRVLSVSADGERLILTAYGSGVRIYDPTAGRTLKRFTDLEQPVSAIRYADVIAVTEHGTGRVLALSDDGTAVLAEDLVAPTGLATDGPRLFVSERARGEILEIARDGVPVTPRVVAAGLTAPEGIAWAGDALVVVEGESGRVLRIDARGEPMLLALVAPGTPPASDAQPPSMVLNDVAVMDDTLFVTGETDRVLYRIPYGARAAGEPASGGDVE